MADLFEDYRLGASWDEMFAAEGQPWIADRLHEQMPYVSGSTGVDTSASQVWRARSGVCQDIAHLTVGALRSLGIPARYVSGYLHPKPSAEVGETVEGPRMGGMVGRLVGPLGSDERRSRRRAARRRHSRP